MKFTFQTIKFTFQVTIDSLGLTIAIQLIVCSLFYNCFPPLLLSSFIIGWFSVMIRFDIFLLIFSVFYVCFVLFRCHSIFTFWPLLSSLYVLSLSLSFYHPVVSVCVCTHSCLYFIRLLVILDLPGISGHSGHWTILKMSIMMSR